MHRLVRFVLPLAAALAFAAPSFAAQTSFATPQDAVDALISAVKAQNKPALVAMFGAGGEKLIYSGDEVADTAAGKEFTDSYAQSHSLSKQQDGSEILIVGDDDWPFPIPLEQVDGKWQFNTEAGIEQVLDRRIGRNELLTIQTLLSVVAAEEDYYNRVQRGTGTGFYTPKLFSTPGQEDGLYWDAGPGEPASPLAPLIASAQDDGYPGAPAPDGKQLPYRGYYFHVLTGQGPNAPGGAMDYVHDGKWTEGFGIVAWPARYGNSGVMTFIVDEDGIVFQKDLGDDTAKQAAAMTLFDPDTSWTRIDLSK
ncbi:MAG TPA: DUF2950 domain-containing protein [Acidocella sp.]|jgi:hypothetical protein|nr:DUF2950 domain-containing protein [Acidocella sp.]